MRSCLSYLYRNRATLDSPLHKPIRCCLAQSAAARLSSTNSDATLPLTRQSVWRGELRKARLLYKYGELKLVCQSCTDRIRTRNSNLCNKRHLFNLKHFKLYTADMKGFLHFYLVYCRTLLFHQRQYEVESKQSCLRLISVATHKHLLAMFT